MFQTIFFHGWNKVFIIIGEHHSGVKVAVIRDKTFVSIGSQQGAEGKKQPASALRSSFIGGVQGFQPI